MFIKIKDIDNKTMYIDVEGIKIIEEGTYYNRSTDKRELCTRVFIKEKKERETLEAVDSVYKRMQQILKGMPKETGQVNRFQMMDINNE